MDRGALNGTAFTESVPGTAADYSFFTYTFRLRNGGAHRRGDGGNTAHPRQRRCAGLCHQRRFAGKRQYHRIRRGERDVWSVVLTSAQNQTDRQVSRSFKITYYIWGIPMSVTAKYN